MPSVSTLRCGQCAGNIIDDLYSCPRCIGLLCSSCLASLKPATKGKKVGTVCCYACKRQVVFQLLCNASPVVRRACDELTMGSKPTTLDCIVCFNWTINNRICPSCGALYCSACLDQWQDECLTNTGHEVAEIPCTICRRVHQVVDYHYDRAAGKLARLCLRVPVGSPAQTSRRDADASEHAPACSQSQASINDADHLEHLRVTIAVLKAIAKFLGARWSYIRSYYWLIKDLCYVMFLRRKLRNGLLSGNANDVRDAFDRLRISPSDFDWKWWPSSDNELRRKNTRHPLILHTAQAGHYSVLELLLDRRASPNTVSEHGTPLMLATQHNECSDVARLLLDRRANVNLRSSYENALFVPCQSGKREMVALLLEYRADVNVVSRCNQPRTPIFGACYGGHIGVTQLLLHHRAKLDVFMPGPSGPMTPLDLARRYGHDELVSVLDRYS